MVIAMAEGNKNSQININVSITEFLTDFLVYCDCRHSIRLFKFAFECFLGSFRL